jgi:hypothetical protein
MFFQNRITKENYMIDVLSEIVESILEDEPGSAISSSTVQGHIAAYDSRIYDEIAKQLMAKGYKITD